MAINHKAVSYFRQAPPREMDVAQSLGEAFDISFGKRHEQISFWIANPQRHVQERFGFKKELLVLYCCHPHTDARVLTAMEKILRMPNFRHRLDRVVVLLVHERSNEEVEKLVASETDRLIVPISAEQAIDPQRGNFFVRSQIARVTGSIDLFGISSPITSDEYFFGREELLQQLMVRTQIRKQNTGVFGLRKTGKTSVLRALGRRLGSQPIATVYTDCANPGIHGARWWQVLAAVKERLQHEMKMTHGKRVDLSREYVQNTAGEDFLRECSHVLDLCEMEQIVLMLDEVEYITHGLAGALGEHWDHDFVPFWQTLRSAHQELQGRLTFIVAGVNPACVEKSHFGTVPNPIFQLAVPTYLEPFTRDEVRAMVRTIGRYSGVSFEEDTYGFLTDTYGGHPFLIRIACSEVWRNVETTSPEYRVTITAQDFGSNRVGITARLSQPIRDILLSLVWWYPEEYDVLRILADGDEGFVREYFASDAQAVIQFSKYGILKSDAPEQFAIVDLRHFLREHGEDYKAELSPFRRGDIPPHLLPQLPDIKTLGQLFQKRTEVESKLRQVIVLYLGIKSNWRDSDLAKLILQGIKPRPDRRAPAELFVGREARDVMHELYTEDLKNIILSHWDVFTALFENRKERFKMNMYTINIARHVDSHTKPVTHTEAVDFQNSYSWILSKLDVVPGLKAANKSVDGDDE